MNRVALALTLLTFLLFPGAGSAALSPSQMVTLVIHVPLQYNGGAPVQHTTLAAYEAAFHTLGPVVDHPGIGLWSEGGSVVTEPDDHVFILTTAAKAHTFLATFLPRMKRDLRQDATLGEVFGGSFAGSQSENRRRVDVRVALTGACARDLEVATRIFAPYGASEFSDIDGIHIYSSLRPKVARIVESDLTAQRIQWTEASDTFELYTGK